VISASTPEWRSDVHHRRHTERYRCSPSLTVPPLPSTMLAFWSSLGAACPAAYMAAITAARGAQRSLLLEATLQATRQVLIKWWWPLCNVYP